MRFLNSRGGRIRHFPTLATALFICSYASFRDFNDEIINILKQYSSVYGS